MDKIHSFFGKLAHKAIANMLRMHLITELADIWYTENLST